MTLTRDDELRLVDLYRAGDVRARDTLIASILPYVAAQARCYEQPGAEYDDLYSEGCIAALAALERFDPARGCRFLTFAAKSIRPAMQVWSRKARVQVSPGASTTPDARRVFAARKRISRDVGEAEQIAARTGVPQERVQMILDLLDSWMTEESDAHDNGFTDPHTRTHARRPPIVNGAPLCASTPSPEEACEEVERLAAVTRAVERALHGLTDRQAAIVRAIWLSPDGERSRENVGREFGVCRERVRQVELMVFTRARRRGLSHAKAVA